ncbi:MAG TPA: peptidoglycan-binding domain-containing protein, partial [Gaiellales bacterium]|nr:peptidoglycan-binding domain-containing protein [Gaiellales bacterium]
MSMTRVLAIAAVVVAGGAAAGASVAVWQSTPGVQSPAAATAAVLPAGPGRLRPIPHPPVARLVVLRYPTLTVGDSGTRVLRLQQLLADTAYLPLRFHRTGRPRISPLAARAGSFSWRFAPPAGLAAQWQRGTFGEVTRGAVMTFEAEHGLTPDGIAGPRVWRALVAAAAHGRWTHRPYVYAYVSETLPESITIYAD